jgi:hypothetical protein
VWWSKRSKDRGVYVSVGCLVETRTSVIEARPTNPTQQHPPNTKTGAGKSSLLDCISLRNHRFEGQVYLGKKPVDQHFFSSTAYVHQVTILTVIREDTREQTHTNDG